MRVTKTISIELIRSGPPHNQLLSPLTPYLALCDGHAAETLRLPFEHHDFILQMQALRYQQGSELTWRARFAQVARDMANVLGQIPGLATTMGRGRVDGCELVHVEAVLSASELALLPFEAADSPSTFASAGLPLSLQTVLPVSLTRRNRRYTGADVKWPRRPKILIAVASPPGYAEVPALAHVMAIRKAIAPWVVSKFAEDPEAERMEGAPQTNIEELLTVLDGATVQSLRQTCAASPVPYTHVHILAHGDVRGERLGERFVLAFHGPNGKDLVDGRQLAAALRPHGHGGSGCLASPTVVTIASCDGGNNGDVVFPGGSIAHDLHEAGIPFVVASQFPLTFAGSVVLTETLYERLLWGDDPRLVLHDARQRLNLLSFGHDWASIIAYAALPDDLEHQLTWVRAQQARRAAEAALAGFDQARPRLGSDDQVERMQAQLESARRHLLDAFPDDPSAADRSMMIELHAMLATIDKREAEVLQRRSSTRGPTTAGTPTRKERELLLSAQQHYLRGLRYDRANHWLATQYVFLCAILGKTAARNVKEWMTVARFSAREETREGTPSQRAWAYASLLELSVLGIILGIDDQATSEQRLMQAREDAEAMIALVGMRSFEVHSTLNQLERYDLWAGLQHPAAELIIAELMRLLETGGEWPAATPASPQEPSPHSEPPAGDADPPPASPPETGSGGEP